MLRTVTPMVVCLLGAADASADITWAWSFGTESGIFVTDGELDGPESAPPGTYTILDFKLNVSIDPSLLGSLLEGAFEETQPTQGFVWDGSRDTQWFRDSGGFTNGTNIFSTRKDRRYLFNPGSYTLDDIFGFEIFASGTELNLVPAPEPSSVYCVLAAFGTLAWLAARGRRSW